MDIQEAIIAFVAPILGILGAGASVAGSISAANAQSASAAYQAQVARNNALMAQRNAEYTIRAGEANAEAESLKGSARVARAKAAIAANGVDVNEGSAVDVVSSEREAEKLDTLTTMNNAQWKAYGYRTQAADFESQAGLHDAEAKSAKTAGALNAATGLIGSFSSLAGKWAGGLGSG